jgi:hypothetical protein
MQSLAVLAAEMRFGLQQIPVAILGSGRMFWLIGLFLLCGPASLAEDSYQRGTLMNVSHLAIDSGVDLVAHLSVCCKFQLQASSLVYSFSLPKPAHAFGWAIGNTVWFRVEKQNILLKKSNGKIVRAKLLTVTSLKTTESRQPQRNDRDPRMLDLPPPLPPASKANPVVPLELDFLVGRDSCVQMSADLSSGGFFSEFKTKQTTSGPQFRNYSGLITTFPERLTIRVLVSLLPCFHVNSPQESGEAIQPMFTFDERFVRSLNFEGFWKKGLDMKKADLRLLTQSQVSPSTFTGDAMCSWEYELNVWSREVPLTDVLVVEVLSPDRRLLTRFSSSNVLRPE